MILRTNNTSLLAVPFVALLGLGLAACGSSGSSAAPPSATTGSAPTTVSAGAVPTTDASPTSAPEGGRGDACALVTEADATTALGKAAGVGVVRSSPHTSQCIYGTGSIIVTESESGKTMYDQARTAIESAPAGTWKEVSGLGDAAFTAQGGPVVSVEFYKGATLVAITMSGSTASAPSDAAVTLAQNAAARI